MLAFPFGRRYRQTGLRRSVDLLVIRLVILIVVAVVTARVLVASALGELLSYIVQVTVNFVFRVGHRLFVPSATST
jgi:hypothetical protein